ncbi:hypothetical protein M405DRAFT_100949 [Rhizopogon salebrosus TDB-379]|nr:hypothetical protein M405DRAFT_100949 [Rhizopogon salebrosus TDB-379]
MQIRNCSSPDIVLMRAPRYYGYLVTDKILQQFLPVGGKLSDSTPSALLALMCDGNVLLTSQARRVLTGPGESCWSIALAYSGRGDGLPFRPPPEESYQKLKEVLEVDVDPSANMTIVKPNHTSWDITVSFPQGSLSLHVRSLMQWFTSASSFTAG